MARAQSTVTTDHDEIRSWAEERGARPACVRGTGGGDDPGMIRLDFPGYSGADSLEEISWDDWFRSFDENGLALLHQETTAGGEKSNFNKLVSRETAEKAGPGRRSASKGSRKSGKTSAKAAKKTSSRPARKTGTKSASETGGRTAAKSYSGK